MYQVYLLRSGTGARADFRGPSARTGENDGRKLDPDLNSQSRFLKNLLPPRPGPPIGGFSPAGAGEDKKPQKVTGVGFDSWTVTIEAEFTKFLNTVSRLACADRVATLLQNGVGKIPTDKMKPNSPLRRGQEKSGKISH